jgi:hypothetical protein
VGLSKRWGGLVKGLCEVWLWTHLGTLSMRGGTIWVQTTERLISGGKL